MQVGWETKLDISIIRRSRTVILVVRYSRPTFYMKLTAFLEY